MEAREEGAGKAERGGSGSSGGWVGETHPLGLVGEGGALWGGRPG